MLTCPLEQGEQYTVTLNIASPRNATELSTSRPDLRDLGLWLTGRFIFVVGDSILQPARYLSLVGATVRDLKNGWFEVRKEFVATGRADHMIVGNFNRLANIDIMDQRNNTNPSIDILVDDISIIPKKGNSCANARAIKDSLYAVRRRHSVKHPEDMTPDEPDEDPADNGQDSTQKKPIPDTPIHYYNNPIKDPLFGPEPRRVSDTPKAAPLPPVADTIILRNIQFDFDKYLVENPDTLQRYQKLLTRQGIKRIQVVGFTDDVGSAAYNLDLSRKRALEVARLLTSRFNISPALIGAEGRGISTLYPTRDLNRRVEIYIFHDNPAPSQP
jgi:outer membrane protein OmpA-like peptidoglycan-associated protein